MKRNPSLKGHTYTALRPPGAHFSTADLPKYGNRFLLLDN